MIDPKSQSFMDYFSNQWSNPTYRAVMKSRARMCLSELLDKPDEELHDIIMTKLQAGAEEHGPPQYNQSEVAVELQAEAVDLLGWNAIGEWCGKTNS